MIKLTVIGHLGQDAVIKTLGAASYLSFSVAHSERYKGKDGVDREHTQWISCLKRIGDNSTLASYLKKGTKVYVEGRMGLKLLEGSSNKPSQVFVNCEVQNLELISVKSEAAREQQSNEEPEEGEMKSEDDNKNGLPF
jgi:single-strand DNA-binding protein